MNWLVLLMISLGLALPSTAHAHLRPQCPPSVKHCKIHWVSYTFQQPGHDEYGNRYVRTCHVPAYAKSWCGPWRRVS